MMDKAHISKVVGVPLEVISFLFKERNIDFLYDWQCDCLDKISKVPEESVLLCLPTSGGKTLISEILALRYLVSIDRNERRDVVLVLPFISLVQERIRQLGAIADRFDFHLEEYAGLKGRIPPNIRRRSRSLFVCTIEKADLLCDHLILMNKMKTVGLAVFDEIHMLNEEKRGPTIERLLTKIRLVQMKLNSHLRILSMSATLDYDNHLGTFLNVSTDLRYHFRPVNLSEFVCMKRNEVHRVVKKNKGMRRVEFARYIGLRRSILKNKLGSVFLR
ncbi:hypothetical protein ACOME3_001311 [Neoechinorhynchus agilis]